MNVVMTSWQRPVRRRHPRRHVCRRPARPHSARRGHGRHGRVETCRRLKAIDATRDIPVLFISARDETASLVSGFEAGGVDYIVKPFEYEEVLSRVGLI